MKKQIVAVSIAFTKTGISNKVGSLEGSETVSGRCPEESFDSDTGLLIRKCIFFLKEV